MNNFSAVTFEDLPPVPRPGESNQTTYYGRPGRESFRRIVIKRRMDPDGLLHVNKVIHLWPAAPQFEFSIPFGSLIRGAP